MTFKKTLQPFFFILLFAFAATAYAMTLQQAMGQLGSYKSQGLVGEKTNGYLGVVTDQNEASQLVELINDARKAQYQKMADANNIAIQDIETLAGKKALEKTKPGHYIEINGRWVKK
ncbi:MAG: YdbL family protein [Pseudomonadota bacterium]